jgi:hypothetical protein
MEITYAKSEGNYLLLVIPVEPQVVQPSEVVLISDSRCHEKASYVSLMDNFGNELSQKK